MGKRKNIIDRIKDTNVKPIPKRYFVVKNNLLWALFIIGVLIGAVGFSIVLFSIQQTDFDLISHMSHSWLEFVLGLLPFFWIIFLIIFLVVAILGIKNSKRGYKFSTSRLVGISTALSILLGTIFFIGGGAQKLEKAFAIRVSLYESIEEKKIKIWSMPEEGYLSGVIQSVKGDTIILLDFDKKEWAVFFEEAFIPPVVSLEGAEKVKIVGKKQLGNVFNAEEIRPWGGRRRMKKNKK